MTLNTARLAVAIATLTLPACATMGGGAMGGADAFSDPNVAATASASNADEIQTSQLALQKAQNAQVREFAQSMVTEHTALQQEMERMLASKGMAPMDNALSGTMKRNLPRTLQMLQAMNGMEFDLGYMLHQVGSHEMTLHTLDTTLIPSTTDPEMRAMLQNRVRPGVAQHLMRAKQIVAALRAH